ncbi:MAG: DNA-packaging protein [Desulfobacteraceae bacterium]|nr:DNA-packaging protein [Desulfobacteraceae bacterium]
MSEEEKTDKRIGNQFWKLRSKHGRDKLFATSELLWDAACEYFQWCDDNPWIKTETKERSSGKDITTAPSSRPYTISGLCLYLDCNIQYLSQFKADLPENEEDFSLVITRIEQTIYTQKFEGAAVGVFNANIIARDLGLKDASTSEVTGTVAFTKIERVIIDPDGKNASD